MPTVKQPKLSHRTTRQDRYNFSDIRVAVPSHDSDVVIVFPNGKEMTIQLRPSNAEEGYNGSLDILLAETDDVTCWIGQDMQPAKSAGRGSSHVRKSDQLMMTLPFNHDE